MKIKSTIKFSYLKQITTLSIYLGMILTIFQPNSVYAGSGELKDGKFNISISIRYNASAATLDALKMRFQQASELLFDATDGQHQFGKIFVCNNSRGGKNADFWIRNDIDRSYVPGSCVFPNPGLGKKDCRIMQTEKNTLNDSNANADGRHVIVHEFGHYAYGVRDEYVGPSGTAECLAAPFTPASLMENFWLRDISEFCVSSNHDPDGDTRQEQSRGESVWETMSGFFSDLTVPTGLPTDAPPSGAGTIEWIVLEPETRLVLVIDRSGSMNSNNKIQLAREGAKLFTDLVSDGDKLAVVSYASAASVNFSLQTVNSGTKAAAKAAIDGISASGSTNIGGGLRVALNQILGAGDRGCQQVVILLTNGQHNIGEDPLNVLSDLKDNGVIVNTIGLEGNTNTTLLTQIANDTGGRFFFAASSADLQTANTQLFTESTENGGLITSALAPLNTGDMANEAVTIDDLTEQATFLISWPVTANIDLTLQAPDGTIITPSTADTDPNITFVSEPNHELYTVNSPQPGDWVMQLNAISASISNKAVEIGTAAAQPVEVAVQALGVSENIVLTANPNKLNFEFPEPVLVQAEPVGKIHVVGATVTGTVSRPDGSTVSLTLFDDGSPSHGDEKADDGVYSNFFSQYNEDGAYEFEISASTENGFLYTGEGLFGFLDLGEIPPEGASNTPAPVFVRKAGFSVVVSNVPATILPHPFVFLADKQVSVAGMSGSEGDIHANDYIRFRDGSGGTHTGNLSAVDDIEIGADNTISGNAIAGDMVENSGTITGVVTENGAVAVVALPEIDFVAGGADVTVPVGESSLLLPDTYGFVKVKTNGTLSLIPGEYFIDDLELERGALLSIDAANGPVTINVVSDLDFEDESIVEIIPLGESGTADVIFNSLQTKDLDIGPGAVVLGTIIAPNAEVGLKRGSRFKGAICAQTIRVQSDVVVLHHSSSTALPAPLALNFQKLGDFSNAVINEYELEQNYPNPFNPTTTIRFALPAAGETSLKVFDIQGRLVKTIISGYLEAGRYDFQWNSTDDSEQRVASGVYFYELQAADFRQVKKMLLLK